MSSKKKQSACFLLTVLASFALALASRADSPCEDGEGLGGCAAAGCCGCEAVCCAKRVATTEEKHCWCVTREEVCVPRVRCPWEPGGSPLTCFDWLHRFGGDNPCCKGDGCGAAACGGPCCGARCGKVRCVRDLEKKTYEVDACTWKWEVRRLPPCACPSCGCERCGAGGRFGCGCATAIGD